jgi:hypothetical protein
MDDSITNDQDDVIARSIDFGFKPTLEHLSTALIDGSDDCAALLIPAIEGFEVNTPFEVYGGEFTGTEKPALFHAAWNFMPRTVRLLIDMNADVHYADEQGTTAAHIAAEHSENGDISDIMALLQAAGADMNALDQFGNTPTGMWKI